MSEIPAPLLSRHIAVAVVAVSILGFAAAVATVVVPIDGSEVWLVVARQAVLALQAVVVALGIFLVWRTLAERSTIVTIAALAGIAGLLLLAGLQIVGVVVVNAWPFYSVIYTVEAARGLAGVLIFFGLAALGISVMRQGAWRGWTQWTLLVAAFLVIALLVAWPFGYLAIPYAIWSASFLGLAVGLRTPRVVPVSGIPDSQLGAARV